MKKTIALFLAVVLVLSLTACGSKRESAQSVAEKAIKAVQTVDLEAIRSYWGDGEFVDEDAADPQSVEMLKLIADGMTYKVLSAKEDESAGTATVTVEFTNVDMSKIMSDFMSEMLSEALNYAFLPEDQQPSEEEMNQMSMDIFKEIVAREDNTTVTNSVDITLSLVDDAWKIDSSETVVDAMLGGLYAFTESMSGLS